MCFAELIVRLFTICYSNMYVYSLFTKIILLDAVYAKILLKFLFLQYNLYPAKPSSEI